MPFIKTDVKELMFAPVKSIGENWGILTGLDSSGNFNSMTVSWGGVGVLWSKPSCFVFVRPGRHTFRFTEDGEFFSLALMPEGYHEKMAVFGSKSGRDCDKYKESGFTVADENGVKYPEEAEIVFICKKSAAGDIEPSWFIDPEIDGKNYPRKDYHRMYVGEIVTCLKKI